ncbi:MAG TPA: TetR family transcriptional regulator [Microthrixaceae bacterium]|nr:TetR family transcriptional regulator [Microthrixaceae bacterium]
MSADAQSPQIHACADPDSPNRRERKIYETRRSILAAARELIETQGYTETTVDQIAERADIAPRTFFRYFPNKESLLFAEFDAGRDAMLAALEARPEGEDVFDSIAAVLKEFSLVVDERWDDYSWAHKIIRAESQQGSQERALMRLYVESRIAATIAKRIGTDPETDPRPAAWAMAIMAIFGQSMAKGPHASPTGRTYDLFIETLQSTETALGEMRASALRRG